MTTATLVGARALRAVRNRRRPASPAQLAQRMIPNYRITPTLALISDALVDAVENPNRRYIITCPPRTGKSVLVSQVGTVWALSRRPDEQVIIRSYADSLGEEHSREARRFVTENTELLGIELSADRTSAGRWQVANHRGGLLAGGILTGTTGFGANLLIIDDPVKGHTDADSRAYRERLLAEFQSALLSRLMPGASCVIIATRWHESDLPGALLAGEDSRWTWINVPAVSTTGVPDALERDRPGVAMTTAIGRSAEEFDQIRREVGSRAWAALYLGVPSAPEGNLIRADWLDDWRMPAAPPRPLKTVVAVDPADSGERDSAGIVAASMDSAGVVAVIADVSAPMTSDAWARAAVELAVDVGASEIVVEGFSARETYVRVVKEALRRVHTAHPIKVSSWPPKGSGRGGGDAIARSAALLQGFETGTVRLAGHFPDFETKAVQWQAGQHQPDALAALVAGHDVLVHSLGQRVTFASPVDVERRMRERERNDNVIAGRFDRLGPSTADPRLTRRLGGGGYDPLAAPRKTIRGL